MATLAVGDVHGQLGSLRRLLAKARPIPGADKVVFVGDLVGRGSGSADVVREVAALGDRAEVVLGNHELHMLHGHYVRGEAGGGDGGVGDVADADELCNWLRRRPLAHELPAVPALVVHAGVWHGWDMRRALELADEAHKAFAADDPTGAMAAMHGNSEDRWVDNLPQGPRLQAIVNIMTRMRACGPDGRLVFGYAGTPAEKLPDGARRWFDMLGRKMAGTLIVCGHWSALGLFQSDDVAMIDCGCCFGGPLAGLWVEDRRLVFSD